MNDYDVILEFISEVQDTLAQLLSSGFFAAHEFTINELKRFTNFLAEIILKYLSHICPFLALECEVHSS